MIFDDIFEVTMKKTRFISYCEEMLHSLFSTKKLDGIATEIIEFNYNKTNKTNIEVDSKIDKDELILLLKKNPRRLIQQNSYLEDSMLIETHSEIIETLFTACKSQTF